MRLETKERGFAEFLYPLMGQNMSKTQDLCWFFVEGRFFFFFKWFVFSGCVVLFSGLQGFLV